MLNLGLKVGLKLNSSAKSLKLNFGFKVNLNNGVLNQTSTMHLDRQFC